MVLQRSTLLIFATVSTLAMLVLSGWHPYDRATWLMEVLPVIITLPLLWLTYRRFPLTNLLYALIFLHAAILMLGGAYSYARVPIGFQLQDLFQLDRNPYDKIGHFFQGLVPALVAREILIRGGYVRGRRMLAFLVICIVLAVSATYEFIEWGAALLLGQGADDFLGTQGDPWDTQSDMFFAFVGSLVALTVFSRFHDSQLAQLGRGRDLHDRSGVSLESGMSESPSQDPFDLDRFVAAQRDSFDRALAEVKRGRKASHWMWYIFPQLRGLGYSTTSHYYGISGPDEAYAYLRHQVLGPRLIAICEAVLDVEGRSATEIFSKPDDMKLRSCATLFAHVSEPDSLFHKIIDRYFDGSKDQRTIQLLEGR